MRILLAEDEPQLAGFISKSLREQSYAVDIAPDGAQAQYLAEINAYDLLILDVMLPVKSGMAVCRQLRDQGFRAPILMLTALDAPEQTVKGLNSGADDYMTKPFDLRILLARVRALLRRNAEVRPNIIQVGDLKLNTLNHTAYRGTREVRLTAKEYALLEMMMMRANEVLGRAEIADHVWDDRYDPFSNIIDVYVKRLRRKIDQQGDEALIHTRRGEGYILTTDMQHAE